MFCFMTLYMQNVLGYSQIQTGLPARTSSTDTPSAALTAAQNAIGDGSIARRSSRADRSPAAPARSSIARNNALLPALALRRRGRAAHANPVRDGRYSALHPPMRGSPSPPRAAPSTGWSSMAGE
jgi:hypothetical protein